MKDPSRRPPIQGRRTDSVRIALVAARFNQDITDAMVQAGKARIDERGHEHAGTTRVPGAFDTPLATQRCLERDDIDGVVVIGAVVQGDTDHDQVLMQATCQTLQSLSLRMDKPVALAITGPGMTQAEAEARIDYAAQGVDAVLELDAALHDRALGFDPATRSH